MTSRGGGKYIAIITGAGRGIGLAIAQRLIARRVGVWSFDLVPCPAEGVESLTVDMRDHARVRDCMAVVVGSQGMPNLLVNNAALAGRAAEKVLYEEGATEHFAQLCAINLIAPFLLLELFARNLIANRQGGRVVNIASATAHRGGLRTVGYAATKSGVIGLSRAAAVELAPHNIQVNTISPGYVATAMALAEYPLTELELAALNPQGRTGTADEIAAFAEYLLLDSSEFITGADLRIDGGATVM